MPTSIGLVSSTYGTGGGSGLGLGGLLVDHAGYHSIFWLGAIMAAVSALLTAALVPESQVRTLGRVDVRGAGCPRARSGASAARDLTDERVGLD